MKLVPFSGKGLAFPVRIDPTKGGFQLSEGFLDETSVKLEYLAERWTTRDPKGVKSNHIAESIAHILLTAELEHDTLPWFGSKLKNAIFEPNSVEFQLQFSLFLRFSTERWEKRAVVPQEGVHWGNIPYLTDQGILPLKVDIQFLVEQQNGNLVAPFVNPRQARSQEYPSPLYDSNNHDYYSSYYNRESITRGASRGTRVKAERKWEKAPDDRYHKVKHNQTWMLISYDLYSDIRFWRTIAHIYIQDNAEIGSARSILNPSYKLKYGTLLRVPSTARILNEFK
jgi:phage baseplate assembly protein W